jgi:hypothetical protein
MLVRLGRQGGQVLDGLSKKRTCRHQADEKCGTTAGQLAGNDQYDTKDLISKEVNPLWASGRPHQP